MLQLSLGALPFLSGNIHVHALAALPLFILAAATPVNSWTASPTDLSPSVLLAQPPAPISQSLTLTIGTFNVQDLPVFSQNRPERMAAIGIKLKEMDPDIIGIQEAFVAEDRDILLTALKGGRLKHHQYFPSGTVGSGLLMLSAYPIVEHFFFRYTECGPWYKPYEGDWWAGKGISLVRVQLPEGIGFLDIYNTHAQAGYGNPAYGRLRESQMRELATFIQASATHTAPAFLVGDLNCQIGWPDYQIAVKEGGLTRQLTLETHVDHIFSVESPHYSYTLLKSVPIKKTLHVGSFRTPLSDHTGYLSTMRVAPSQPLQ